MDSPSNVNPYAPPAASSSEGPVRPKRRPFRWRALPTVVIGLMSIIMLLVCIFLPLHLWHYFKGMIQFGRLLDQLIVSATHGLAGTCGLFCARAWWKGRWWLAAGLSVAFYMLGVLASHSLLAVLDR